MSAEINYYERSRRIFHIYVFCFSFTIIAGYVTKNLLGLDGNFLDILILFPSIYGLITAPTGAYSAWKSMQLKHGPANKRLIYTSLHFLVLSFVLIYIVWMLMSKKIGS
ncbi:MAG: hypothetical protein ACI83I_000538 [Bacteroidia bacterium]|jgi:hypothetical protein